MFDFVVLEVLPDSKVGTSSPGTAVSKEDQDARRIRTASIQPASFWPLPPTDRPHPLCLGLRPSASRGLRAKKIGEKSTNE